MICYKHKHCTCFFQPPLRCMLAGSDWLPAGFGRWSRCQTTRCMFCSGWVCQSPCQRQTKDSTAHCSILTPAVWSGQIDCVCVCIYLYMHFCMCIYVYMHFCMYIYIYILKKSLLYHIAVEVPSQWTRLPNKSSRQNQSIYYRSVIQRCLIHSSWASLKTG